MKLPFVIMLRRTFNKMCFVTPESVEEMSSDLGQLRKQLERAQYKNDNQFKILQESKDHNAILTAENKALKHSLERAETKLALIEEQS